MPDRTYTISYPYMRERNIPWHRCYWLTVYADRSRLPQFRQVGYRYEGDRDEWEISRKQAAEILVDAHKDGSATRLKQE